MPPRNQRFVQVPRGTTPIVTAGRQPWSDLTRAQRRSLYDIGAQAGQSRYQVRQAYAENRPIGSSQWFRRRARVIISGEIKPGVNTPYSKLSSRGRQRLDTAIAQRQQNNPGLTRRRALYEYEQGIWRPNARNPKDRLTPEERMSDERQVPIVSTRGLVYVPRNAMEPAYADRAWAHYFAVEAYLEGNNFMNRQGESYTSSSARKLEQWGQEPIESRMIRTYDGRAWELETDLNRLDQMGLSTDLSRYAVVQQTGSDSLTAGMAEAA